jgi:RND superfamily putative drug exporter
MRTHGGTLPRLLSALRRLAQGQINDRGLFIDGVAGGRHRLIEVMGEGGTGQVFNDEEGAPRLKLRNATIPSLRKLKFRWEFFTWTGRFATRWPLLVIGIWLALPCALILAFPPLSHAIKAHPVPLVPSSAPAMVTEQRMTEAFHESGGDNLLLTVLTDDGGLSRADEDVYRALVTALRSDEHVKMLQEFVNSPALREMVTSKDHKAWILPIGLAGGLNTPTGHDAYQRTSEIVKRVADGSSLKATLTGPSATISDLTDVGSRDMHHIEIATAILVLGILMMVYRNPLTMMLPLITIGLSLMTTRGVVAGLSQIGLGVSNETVIFMTAMMAGAGTDYAVFLISRYHDELRTGMDSDSAVMAALASVGKVVAASAATVAVTFLCMSFAKLGLLATVGPALAIAIGIAVLAAFTLLPAILVLAGRRGWVHPRRELTTHLWRRLGEALVRRPGVYLASSLAVLAILATCGCFVQFNWDESKTLPASVPSNRGYAALAAHFPLNETIPQYILIRSPHDLRGPNALADLEQLIFRVSQIPAMGTIRGVTRPLGKPPEQASIAYQAGVVGDKLRAAAATISDNRGNLDRLTAGAQRLADTLAAVRNKVDAAAAAGTAALNDPRVQDATSLLSQLNRDGTFSQLNQLTQQLPDTPETQGINAGVRNLRSTVSSALGQLQSLGMTSTGSAQAQVARLRSGADELADGSRLLSDGVRKLVDSTDQITAGMRDASRYLLALKHDAGSDPAIAGFFIPAQALFNTDLRAAAEIFVSPDGHTVRYLFQTTLNPFRTAAMDQVNQVVEIAHRAQPNTALADADIEVTGFPAVNRDLRDYYNHDMRFIMVTTLIVVFAILVMLLRAIVAPLHLIISVVISYLSALGVGVIAFQFIGGGLLSWSVPGMAFIVLVAVGADYNMLLISRVRDESPHSVRTGVIKTVGSTGGVITSAGLIFAASMFGLLFGSVTGMVQSGFIIGIGLLVDTFLVRTVTVPALAVLIGRYNWWPTLWGRRAIPLPPDGAGDAGARGRDGIGVPIVIAADRDDARQAHREQSPVSALLTSTSTGPKPGGSLIQR